MVTLFPEMCETVLNSSIIGRARKDGLVTVYCHNIRDYTLDRHRRVDDYPYGGGLGMVMQPEPIANCFDMIKKQTKDSTHFIYMSPQGKQFNQQDAQRFVKMNNLTILCGHYEGVDQRLIEEYIDEEISIGDFVLTGGEIPALAVIDSVARMIPGVLSESGSFEDESHFSGLLEYAQYTRPPLWRNRPVPEVLLSGNHALIAKHKRRESLIRTREKRPDLFEKITLDKSDKKLLAEGNDKNR